MEVNISTAATTVLSGALIWVGSTLIALKTTLVELKTILVGSNGSPGLAAEVKALRDARHAQADEIHTLEGKFAVLDIRVVRLEEREEARP